MTATHEQYDRQYPGREEMFALVDGLGPSTLFDLFEEYEVPEGDRFGLIEEVLGLLVVHGRPVENLPVWFVETLERRCRAFVAARDDGEPVPVEASGFALVGRVEYLCHESQGEVFRDPRRAVELAERAVELADRIDPEVCGEGVATEHRILARAWLGNARRVASDLPLADRVFQEAICLISSAAPTSVARVEVLKLLASLRIDQGRYREARRVLLEARRFLRGLDDASNISSILIKLCLCAGYAGDAEEAVRLARRAVEQTERTGNERLKLYAQHNVADWLVEAGNPAESLVHFEGMQSLYDRFLNDPWVQLRRRWLEGRIQAGLGNFQSAQDIFGEVRRTAESRELVYDASMVSIELALVSLQMGQRERVLVMAQDLILFFQSHNLEHHLLAAVKLLHEAARASTLTVGMVSDIRRFFQQSWHNPQARFDPVK